MRRHSVCGLRHEVRLDVPPSSPLAGSSAAHTAKRLRGPGQPCASPSCAVGAGGRVEDEPGVPDEWGMTVPAMFRMKRVAEFRKRGVDCDEDYDAEASRSTAHPSSCRSSSSSSTASWRDEQSEADEGVESRAGPVLIRLDKRRGPIGFVVGSSSRVLRISKVTGGLVEEWNNLHPHRKVGPGDQILEINGVSGDHLGMLRELAHGPDAVKLLVAAGGVGS